MKASRSAGSTTAPHLIILFISFVHAALLKRYCAMMRASWHSKHAVFILICSGPGGKSEDCAYNRVKHASASSAASNALSLYMDFHLISNIDEIAAGIPLHRIRLYAACAIRGA
jgi:hypothetical protein